MKILVFGATGGTGRAFARQALAAGHSVTTFARRPEKVGVEGVTLIKGDAFDAASVDAAVAGHDAVMTSMGTRPPQRNTPVCSEGTRNIIAAMKKHGVRRLVVVSSLGVRESRAYVSAFWRWFLIPVISSRLADKGAMEELVAASDLDWVIVRPAVLTGGKGTGKVHAADDGTIHAGWISRADVAAFCLEQMTGDAWLRRLPTIA